MIIKKNNSDDQKIYYNIQYEIIKNIKIINLTLQYLQKCENTYKSLVFIFGSL